MKKTRIVDILCYIAAALFDLPALYMIFGRRDTTVGLPLLCIGSAMLCFGGALANRYTRHTEKQQDEENKK